MADNSVFISYSRKDREFVQRLAEDLNQRVEGVWFDGEDIRAGDIWREKIIEGVKACKAFVLVLSPNSAASEVALWEVSLAQKYGKTVIPLIYKKTKVPDKMKAYLNEVHYIDLQMGAYADNFEALVDAVVSRGVLIRPTADTLRGRGDGKVKPLLRAEVKVNWGAVFGRVLLWGLAWAIGWGIFMFMFTLTGAVLIDAEIFPNIVVFPVSGFLGGGLGGILAGLFTMLVLRRYAPSIRWKHISPSIWIWAVSGTVAGMLTIFTINGVFAGAGDVDCSGLGFGDCLGAGFGDIIGRAILGLLLAVFLLLFIWLITGLLTGWIAVRMIRRLEPGLRGLRSFWVVLGWGMGAILAAFIAGGLFAVVEGVLY